MTEPNEPETTNKTSLAELIQTAETSLYTWKELQALVLDWAKERNLLHKENAPAQYKKIVEEFGEMELGIIKHDTPEIIDGIGDTIVTLIIYNAQTFDINLEPIFVRLQTVTLPEMIYQAKMSMVYLDQPKEHNPHFYLKEMFNCICYIALNYNFSPVNCLWSAYNVIKNRKGKTIDGQFVKDKE